MTVAIFSLETLPFALPIEGGTLLDFDNVADQLQKVYERFVEDKKIDP